MKMYFRIKKIGDIPASYVSLPEGTYKSGIYWGYNPLSKTQSGHL